MVDDDDDNADDSDDDDGDNDDDDEDNDENARSLKHGLMFSKRIFECLVRVFGHKRWSNPIYDSNKCVPSEINNYA